MICSYCDAPMPDISVYCPACGRSVSPEAPAAITFRDRILGALSYVALVPAVILLFLPAFRADRYVRFHSWQSVLFSAAAIISGVILRLLFLLLSLLPFVGFLLAWLWLGIGCLGLVVLWAVLVVKAAQGHKFELPVIGALSEKLATTPEIPV